MTDDERKRIEDDATWRANVDSDRKLFRSLLIWMIGGMVSVVGYLFTQVWNFIANGGSFK